MRFRYFSLSVLVFLAACNNDHEVSKGTFETPAVTTAVVTTPDPVPVWPNDHVIEDTTAYTYGAEASLELAAVSEGASVRLQEMKIKGHLVKYTARAGHLTAYAQKDPNNPDKKDAQATIFYMAYTRDDLPRENRPVTFFWNGGPGSSSIFLHMGSWAPKRLKVNMPIMSPESKKTKPENFPWIDNEETLLEHSDLVFIDPVGTGFSQAIAPHTNQEFWGMDEDARIERDFITRFINEYNRQSSPKYLYGESYSGIRTPIVARMLLEAGTSNYEPDKSGKPAEVLTGMVLNSPILDYNSNTGQGGDASNAGFLPSEGMVASYYKKDKMRGQASAPEYTDTLRKFITEKYNPARSKWYAPGYSKWKSISGKTSEFSAMITAYLDTNPGAAEWYANKPEVIKYAEGWAKSLTGNPVDQAKFEADFPNDAKAAAALVTTIATAAAQSLAPPSWLPFTQTAPGIDFFKDMTSITGLDIDWAKEFEISYTRFMTKVMPELSLNPYDARLNIPKGAYDITFYEDAAFAAGIKAALPDMFNYNNTAQYKASNFDVIPPAWKYSRDSEMKYYRSSIPDLIQTLAYDPSIKMLVVHGYYDLVTPFHLTELDLKNVGLSGRIPVKNYEGGHMIYESEEARAPLKADLDKFYMAPAFPVSPAVAAQAVLLN